MKNGAISATAIILCLALSGTSGTCKDEGRSPQIPESVSASEKSIDGGYRTQGGKRLEVERDEGDKVRFVALAADPNNENSSAYIYAVGRMRNSVLTFRKGVSTIVMDFRRPDQVVITNRGNLTKDFKFDRNTSVAGTYKRVRTKPLLNIDSEDSPWHTQ